MTNLGAFFIGLGLAWMGICIGSGLEQVGDAIKRLNDTWKGKP